MTRISLAMTETAYEAVRSSLGLHVETAFVGSIGVADLEDGGLALFVRDLDLVDEDAYAERSPDRLVIRSSGFMPAFGRAASSGAGGLFAHSHPGGVAAYSDLDHVVDNELQTVVYRRTGSVYVSLVVSGTPDHPAFAARVARRGDGLASVQRIRVVGENIRVLRTADTYSPTDSADVAFDRQVRAFGVAGQAELADLVVGVVGVGGTGSAVCEQLARLGVGNIIIVDDDIVTETNVSRLYGSTRRDVGTAKVQVVAEMMRQIRDGMNIVPIVGRVTEQRVARLLRQCDVLFGCTDDQLGRGILCRLAYWYIIPLIDMGVVISRDGDRVREVISRVTLVGPGHACLLCRRRIQPEVMRAEALPPSEREILAAEGYVPGLGEPDPSVVTYTTLTASFATSQLLQRLFGFNKTGRASELLIRPDTGEIRRNRVPPRHGHYCETSSTWGTGDCEPFLGQLWV